MPGIVEMIEQLLQEYGSYRKIAEGTDGAVSHTTLHKIHTGEHENYTKHTEIIVSELYFQLSS